MEKPVIAHCGVEVMPKRSKKNKMLIANFKDPKSSSLVVYEAM
jgi:hypothetical protein